jgi:hypothetical protein
MALASVEKWSRFDADFNHEAFFNNIILLFESDPDAPWVTETLEWWDRYVLWIIDLALTLIYHQRRPWAGSSYKEEEAKQLGTRRRRR